MKVLVYCLVVFASFSCDSKASVDNLVPANFNTLLEDTTKNSDKSCLRPCKFNVKPRRCEYSFTIEPTLGDEGLPAITVNGLSPGPAIHVCTNDIVVVNVHNKIPNQDIAIHWHGVEQKGTPHMDGVPMVTQCPITFGASYKYAFIASAPGTFFYHADSVRHQSDGVFGALIVNQPQPLDPHSSLYDYDRSTENTFLISAKFPKLFTSSIEDPSHNKPSKIIINDGRGSAKIFALPGYGYRLRLINAIALECPVTVEVDSHSMVVVATDGRPVKAMPAKVVQLYPGERMDVVVRATEQNGGYWMRAHGAGACAGLHDRGMFIYSGFNYTSMLKEVESSKNMITNSDPVVNGQMLESTKDSSHENDNPRQIYLGIDKNNVEFKESDIDFRYLSDAVKKRPFYPAPLFLQTNNVLQINGKSFLYPNRPLLLHQHDISNDAVCLVGEEVKQRDPQCIQIINAVKGELLEIALVNEGHNSNESYTFHMHGYIVQVIATWQNPDNSPVNKELFQKLDKEGKIIRNIKNPVIKDTFVVPNKGATIVRLKVEQGGGWMLESRPSSFSLPTAILLNVPQSLPNALVQTLFKCGSYRPKDVLLN